MHTDTVFRSPQNGGTLIDLTALAARFVEYFGEPVGREQERGE
jgi:hypothetical protein